MTYAVLTTVKVLDGSIDELAEIFDDANRRLAANNEGWLGSTFTANRETNLVTIIARWRDVTSYERLSNSPEFYSAMAQLARTFDGPPSVSINEVLVDVSKDQSRIG